MKLVLFCISEVSELGAFACLCSQEPRHRYPRGPRQSGEHPVSEDPHQHGAAGGQRLEAVGPRPTPQGALRLTRLQEHHREATGVWLTEPTESSVVSVQLIPQ